MGSEDGTEPVGPQHLNSFGTGEDTLLATETLAYCQRETKLEGWGERNVG